MKKPILIFSAALLLAACSGGTGGNTVDPIANETSVAQSTGAQKYENIMNSDHLVASLGTKCIQIDSTLTSTEATGNIQGVSLTAKLTGDSMIQLDSVNSKYYYKLQNGFTATGSLNGETITQEAIVTQEQWYFDGKLANKVTQNGTVFQRSVAEGTWDAKTAAVSVLNLPRQFVENNGYKTVNYYANDKEYDLRISAKNGTLNGMPITNLDVSFVDGLPNKLVAVYDQSLSNYGLDQNVTVTETLTFSYPNSINITTPDTSNSNW